MRQNSSNSLFNDLLQPIQLALSIGINEILRTLSWLVVLFPLSPFLGIPSGIIATLSKCNYIVKASSLCNLSGKEGN
jgi:hypothetical protein